MDTVGSCIAAAAVVFLLVGVGCALLSWALRRKFHRIFGFRLNKALHGECQQRVNQNLDVLRSEVLSAVRGERLFNEQLEDGLFRAQAIGMIASSFHRVARRRVIGEKRLREAEKVAKLCGFTITADDCKVE